VSLGASGTVQKNIIICQNTEQEQSRERYSFGGEGSIKKGKSRYRRKEGNRINKH